MKVTRLKRGYRIRLSDTEFEAMAEMMEFAFADMQAADPHEEYGIPKRIANLMNQGLRLIVTEDRR